MTKPREREFPVPRARPPAEAATGFSEMPSERSWAESNWSARASMGEHQQITAYCHRGVWLIEVNGDPELVTEDIDLAIQLALAESPRGVVCSLPVRRARSATPALAAVVGAAGRHVRRWPSTPVLMVCDDELWDAASRSPDGGFLGRSSSLLHAWAAITSAAAERVAHLHLQGNALAARTARNFLARTCLDWRIGRQLMSGPLVVSELVTNAVEHAGCGDIDLVLAEHGGSLRIAVRDRAPMPPVSRVVDADSIGGRGLQVVRSLARWSGALPAAGGGKVVWAVLAREDGDPDDDGPDGDGPDGDRAQEAGRA